MARNAATTTRRPGWQGAILALALAAPLAGLALLLTAPSLDAHWEHQPSHFWLVLGTAVVAAILGWAVGDAARRRVDARLFLVSLSFVAAAAFLGLHALATPGVLLADPNAGFVVATPIGLLLSSGFACWSSLRLDGSRARWIMHHASGLRGGLVAVVAAWAGWSLASLPPLDAAPPPEAGSWLIALALPGIALYGVAALRYLGLAHRRRSAFLLAMAASWILLAEAEVAVMASRRWQMSWWEWHVLMLLAFGAIAVAARRLPDTERFGDLYLDEVAAGTRDITVLFADLAGFTSFSETHDPPVVQDMLNTYFAAVLPAVESEGGRLDRFIGDAVMVTFNVAGDQPDHATRAARAALGFQAAAEPVAEAHPEWPRFRVGINTGIASVGVIGGGSERDYTVLGDTVNVASRIESLAPVGAVAVSDGTRRAVDGARVTSLGTVAVKGRKDPVEVWRLDGIDA